MKLQKKTLDVPGIAEIPRPDPSRAGHRTAWLLALLALCAVSLAAYWLTRDEDTREQWRDQAARIIDNATSGTPLAGVSGFLQPPPPPLPASVLAPPTAPGTLSGRNVQGRVGGGEDAQAASGQSGTPGASGVPGPVGAGQASLPKVTEDSRVRPQFVEDLAAYLVSRFRPGQSGGELRVSVQDLNQRYGVRLPGPEEQGKAGREAILRYAFHPAMLQGLYGLYVERFLESLERGRRPRVCQPCRPGSCVWRWPGGWSCWPGRWRAWTPRRTWAQGCGTWKSAHKTWWTSMPRWRKLFLLWINCAKAMRAMRSCLSHVCGWRDWARATGVRLRSARQRSALCSGLSGSLGGR